MDQNQHLNKTAEGQPSGKKKTRRCDGFKMFLAALSFSYICKALGGVIMKTSLTQIERRFEIPSSIAGVIDGSFEMGNLLVIVFVSYFGSKLHRPKLIGIGCFIMGTGSILTGLPHFFMGYYRYSTDTLVNTLKNSTAICSVNRTLSLTETSEIMGKGCEKTSESNMWIYVLMGNMLRGIGETPIVPLGISYIDDFAKEGRSSVYLGSLSAVAMIGPIIGFVMGSVTSKIYVDIGYVNTSTIRITPKDARWVGVWWLNFLICGALSIASSVPFFFLPKNPNKPQKERKASTSFHVTSENEAKNQTTNLTSRRQHNTLNMTGFFQAMKTILTNHLYVIFLFMTLMQTSSVIGSFAYVFKYIEQQYAQSASQANFLLGITILPTIATGMYVGGYIIKKLKLTLVGIAKLSFLTSLISFLLLLLYFTLICESKSVAGLTLTYDGINPVASHKDIPLSYCNSDCNCDESQWEPVCGNNGITYLSPCLAGCKSSGGNKKTNNTVFYDCSCVQAPGFQNGNYSAHLGECPRDDNCKKKYYFYIGVQVINSFTLALGHASFMMLLVKNVPHELKSLAMGFHSMIIRSLGGVLAPIYFGNLIDRTCMKWSVTNCGKRGACRIYNSTLFGYTYLGLILALKFASLVLYIIFIRAMKKKYEGKYAKVLENGRKATDGANLESLSGNGHFVPSTGVVSETRI